MSFFNFQKDKLYSIYDDIETTNFHVGYFIDSDEDFLLFNLITTRGFEDGFFLMREENVYRVDFEDRYIDRITKLMQIHNQCKRTSSFSNSDGLVKSLLEFAQNNYFLVVIELENGDFVTGNIESVESDGVIIHIVSDDGVVEGKSKIWFDSILRMAVDSGEGRNIQALMNQYHK